MNTYEREACFENTPACHVENFHRLQLKAKLSSNHNEACRRPRHHPGPSIHKSAIATPSARRDTSRCTQKQTSCRCNNASHLDNNQKPNHNHHLHRRVHRFFWTGGAVFYYQDREAANFTPPPCAWVRAHTCFQTPAPRTQPPTRATRFCPRVLYMEQRPWWCNRRNGTQCPMGTQHTRGKEQRRRPSLYTT